MKKFMIDVRDQLVSIFEDTLQYHKENDILAKAVESGISQTKLFEPDDYPALPDERPDKHTTIITVTKHKTFEAAMELHKQYPDKKICVLNFASATNPEGVSGMDHVPRKRASADVPLFIPPLAETGSESNIIM